MFVFSGFGLVWGSRSLSVCVCVCVLERRPLRQLSAFVFSRYTPAFSRPHCRPQHPCLREIRPQHTCVCVRDQAPAPHTPVCVREIRPQHPCVCVREMYALFQHPCVCVREMYALFQHPCVCEREMYALFQHTIHTNMVCVCV